MLVRHLSSVDTPIEWSDLEFVYSAEAEEMLLEFVLQSPLDNRADVEVDRGINALFDGAPRLSAIDALTRGSVFHQRPNRAHLHARGLLRASMASGLVALESSRGAPTWRLISPGVVFIPRHGGTMDTRTGVVGPRTSMRGLVKREQNNRKKQAARRRLDLIEGARAVLNYVEQNTPVPEYLRSLDHPPVEIMGRFRDEFDGFVDAMPTWRIGEIIWVVSRLPKAWRSHTDELAAQRHRSSPPELDDFQLPELP